MTQGNDNRRSWLVAAWPGMGNVSVIAAGYLVQHLKAEMVAELSAQGFFDIEQVEVKEGVVVPPHLPRGVFYRWKAPEGKPDLLIFLGEAQPSSDVWSFSHKLLERAQQMGAERVVTFASMASQLHPSQQPRVFGVATRAGILDDLRRLEVHLLQDGQIGGLNGVLLGAAAERGLDGLCLLGEIPYFAAGVPNPKAARGVLDAFSLLAKVEIDLKELARHSEAVDKVLLEMLERLQQSGEAEEVQPGPGRAEFEPAEESDEGGEEAPAEEKTEPKPKRLLDYASRMRVEKLFEEARKNRQKSVQLKKELDRLGVFDQYEDRFLDLFKRAE